MLARIARDLVRNRLRDYPAVAVVGPRQCGKTTLARSLTANYFDLEQQPERVRLDLDWQRVTSTRRLAILDEAQSWPEVFPRLRGAIDENRKRNGRFLLLGSVSPSLMTQVSESLAGRLAIVELTPFLLRELETQASRQRHWLTGGFPDGGILRPGAFPAWQKDYVRLLSQRDLPAWGLPARPQVTERLVRMVAAANGQAWNASQIGKSLGLSYHTVNQYMDYLVGAFLVRRLPAYHANIKKRLVKSPKVYWRDSGVLHSLLGVVDRRSLLGQPWVGASWEGYVVEQVLGYLGAQGRNVTAYHFRTSDQHEIDLLLEIAGDLVAIEVKLTSSPSTRDMDQLEKQARSLGASRIYLVSQTAVNVGDATRASVNLAGLLDRLLEP